MGAVRHTASWSVIVQSNILNTCTQDLSAGGDQKMGREKVCEFLGKAPLASRVF